MVACHGLLFRWKDVRIRRKTRTILNTRFAEAIGKSGKVRPGDQWTSPNRTQEVTWPDSDARVPGTVNGAYPTKDLPSSGHGKYHFVIAGKDGLRMTRPLA